MGFDSFLRSTRKKYANTPHSVFDPIKQHPISEDVINTALPPVSAGSGFDGSDLPALGTLALDSIGRSALANSGSSTHTSPVSLNLPSADRHAFWNSLKSLPTDHLMQVACFLLFGVATTEEIEKRITVPMSTLERFLPVLRERRVQSTDISDRARLAFLELLCLKEIDSAELADPAIFTGFFTEFGIDATLMHEITEGSSSDDDADSLLSGGNEDDSSSSEDEEEARLTLTQLRGVFQCSMVAMDQKSFHVAEKWLRCVCDESKLRMHAAREADEDSSDSSSSSSSPTGSPPIFHNSLPQNSPFEHAESILSSSNGGFGLMGPLSPLALPPVKVDWSRHAYELRFVWLYLMALKNLGLVYVSCPNSMRFSHRVQIFISRLPWKGLQSSREMFPDLAEIPSSIRQKDKARLVLQVLLLEAATATRRAEARLRLFWYAVHPLLEQPRLSSEGSQGTESARG